MIDQNKGRVYTTVRYGNCFLSITTKATIHTLHPGQRQIWCNEEIVRNRQLSLLAHVYGFKYCTHCIALYSWSSLLLEKLYMYIMLKECLSSVLLITTLAIFCHARVGYRTQSKYHHYILLSEPHLSTGFIPRDYYSPSGTKYWSFDVVPPAPLPPSAPPAGISGLLLSPPSDNLFFTLSLFVLVNRIDWTLTLANNFACLPVSYPAILTSLRSWG